MIERLISRRVVSYALVALLTASAHASNSATEVARHLDPQRIEKVGDYFRNEIAAGHLAGAVVLVQQHGQPVLLQSLGVRDVATQLPMTADTIFRIYSMSKPITAVAVMMLVDDGKLRLDDPVAKYIPAFADSKVAVLAPDGMSVRSFEPLVRPITIEDLLRHTSGITYGFYGDTAVRKLYAASNLFDGDIDNATFVDRLAKLPLAEQPGTLWDYGHSFDVLGRVVEMVSGQSLYQFEKQRLLDPLGMTETAFYLADQSKRDRVAEPLPQDRFDRPVAGLDDPIRQRKWESGGAGMIGTIGDYARFVQMLLNGGTLDGTRIIGRKTLALMTSDHLDPGVRIQGTLLAAGHGFGLGFAVRTHAGMAPFPGSAGQFFWSGIAGTFFWIDPAEDLFCVFMAQGPGQRDYLRTLVRDVVYAAVE
jgi:CubicO group peptidase (beta-lactamase class C family)